MGNGIRYKALLAVLLAVMLQLWSAPVALAGGQEPGDAARPKVALVLCGGGAKGAAHLGVLKVLDKLNLLSKRAWSL